MTGRQDANLQIPALYVNADECCGCSACRDICPVNAITMIPDSEGFLYPSINNKKCVTCMRCVNVCPMK